jgi:ketosteroid isomerase-like protein
MSQENVEVVRRVLDRYNETAEPPWDAIDPAVEWVIEPPAWIAGTYRGHEGVRSCFGRIAEAFDRFQFEVDEYVDAGDRVGAIGHSRVHGGRSGVTTGQPFAMVFEIRDGSVVAMRSYVQPDDALEALGG